LAFFPEQFRSAAAIEDKLDETSSETPIVPKQRTKTERELEGGQRLATPQGGVAQPLAAPTHGEATLVHL
jgi:hypothetical protein